MSVAQFDALSPYHPTSEGILAKLMKRPYHERSMESKNIAAIFAGRLLIQTVLMVSYTLKKQNHSNHYLVLYLPFNSKQICDFKSQIIWSHGSVNIQNTYK